MIGNNLSELEGTHKNDGSNHTVCGAGFPACREYGRPESLPLEKNIKKTHLSLGSRQGCV